MTDNVIKLPQPPTPEIRVRKMTYDDFGRVSVDTPAPAGLLVSFGDGTAAEVTGAKRQECIDAIAKVIDPGAWRGSDDMSLTFRRRAKEKAARCLEAIGPSVQP